MENYGDGLSLLVTESSSASRVDSGQVQVSSETPPVSSEIDVPVPDGIDLYFIHIVDAPSVCCLVELSSSAFDTCIVSIIKCFVTFNLCFKN